MKKPLLLLLLLVAVLPLKAQFVEPFDAKVLNNTTFLPYDNLKREQSEPVLIVKKGVHVKVLNRSGINSGRYRVRLDDGSVGWVPAEAFCEKATLGAWDVGGGRCRNIHLDKYNNIKGTDLLVSDNMTPQEYAQLNQAVETRLLPLAFMYLPPYYVDQSRVFSQVDGTHMKGYVHKELCEIFGEPEGRVDKGFTNAVKNLGAIDYFKNIVNNERYDTMVHQYELGYKVRYDKKGIARDNGGVKMMTIPYGSCTLRSVTFERKLKTSVEYTYGIYGEGLRNWAVYSNVYTPAGQKYSVPEVTDQILADNEAYYRALADAENAAAREAERAKPDPFNKVAIRFIVFLVVILFLGSYLTKNRRVRYMFPGTRFIILLLAALALCPWPAHLFDGGTVGFWGYAGLAAAAFTAFVQMVNFWYAVGLEHGCRCPNCGKWCYPDISNEIKTDIRVDAKPVYTNSSPRILIGKTSPYRFNHKINNDDSETIIRTSDIYKIQTSVPLKYKRTADKCCDRCHHSWHVDNEKYSEPIKGPIITKAFVLDQHKWYDVTKINNVEKERRENGYTKRYKGAGAFDYDNWEPYLQRYVKGESGALDEYYEKYFKDE